MFQTLAKLDDSDIVDALIADRDRLSEHAGTVEAARVAKRIREILPAAHTAVFSHGEDVDRERRPLLTVRDPAGVLLWMCELDGDDEPDAQVVDAMAEVAEQVEEWLDDAIRWNGKAVPKFADINDADVTFDPFQEDGVRTDEYAVLVLDTAIGARDALLTAWAASRNN